MAAESGAGAESAAGLRSGELKVDGHVQTVSQQMPLQIAVGPGKHFVQITRPGAEAIGAITTVEADGRQMVPIAAPPTDATLVFDWPIDERPGAELMIDGHSQQIAGPFRAPNPLELPVPPGKHVVRIARAGFESLSQSVELSARADQAIKPTWTPEKKAPGRRTASPANGAPAGEKALAPPSAAEIEKIAKQIDGLYKTSGGAGRPRRKHKSFTTWRPKTAAGRPSAMCCSRKRPKSPRREAISIFALSGIDTLDNGYEIDALELKQKLLEKFITAAKPEQAADAIPVAEQLLDQAVGADRYETALVLATAASSPAAKSKITTRKEIEDRLSRRRHDIRIIEPIYAAAKKPKMCSQKSGRSGRESRRGPLRCFYKNDWHDGLPLLAKCSDEKLRSLAAADLKSPTDGEQQMATADAWWNLAEKEAGIARDTVRLHAGDLYQAATPNLTSALKKADVEKRLAAIAGLRATAATANSSSGLVKPAAKIGFPLDRWVDACQLVDTTRDTRVGKWVRSGDEVSIIEPAEGARIVIPVAVEGSYDLKTEFVRDEGSKDIGTTIPVGSHACQIMLGAGRIRGLDTVSSKRSGEDNNPSKVISDRFQNGHVYGLLAKIRLLDAGKASVNVVVDGKPSIHWEGDPAALCLPAIGRCHDRPPWLRSMEGQSNSQIRRLRMVSGHASVDPAVAESLAPQEAVPATAKVSLKRWFDILKLVDPDKNHDGGNWSRSGSQITGEAAGIGKLELPVTIEGSYEMAVEFTRQAGDSDVSEALSSARTSAWHSQRRPRPVKRVNPVDGRIFADHDNPTHIPLAAIENNHRYKLLIKVLADRPGHASVDVALDGSVGPLGRRPEFTCSGFAVAFAARQEAGVSGV